MSKEIIRFDRAMFEGKLDAMVYFVKSVFRV